MGVPVSKAIAGSFVTFIISFLLIFFSQIAYYMGKVGVLFILFFPALPPLTPHPHRCL